MFQRFYRGNCILALNKCLEGAENANENARVIIGKRDEFKGSLSDFDYLLNGNIENLKNKIKKKEPNDSLFSEIKIINKIWDEEKVRIFNNVVDKILIDLGRRKS
ncbi:hypothetical protein [Nitrosovibrio sp. Nv4]|uniref:hypothetical protein n=1 Tax=Nitrosovibrio sp. Nv4 TaxID=1945880 RepID=UPI000BD5CF3E|nr:hypothetical protein [Nitrosovibrio sp. Nv4]SOD41948.1 hypothetical protein SAMN06298226_2268 [Nitrosovibrio sp. Nv4]